MFRPALLNYRNVFYNSEHAPNRAEVHAMPKHPKPPLIYRQQIGPVALTVSAGAKFASCPNVDGLAADAYTHVQADLQPVARIPAGYAVYFNPDGTAQCLARAVLTYLVATLSILAEGVHITQNAGEACRLAVWTGGNVASEDVGLTLEIATEEAMRLADEFQLPVFLNGKPYWSILAAEVAK